MNAIDQTEKHPKLSAGYNQVNTQQLIERFATHGFKVRKQVTTNVINSENEGFQKHMVRLWQPDLFRIGEGEFPEIVLINSHNGSTSVQLNLGIFRLICSNGLVVGKVFDQQRVRHVGFTYEKLDEGIKSQIKLFPKLVECVNHLKKTDLDYNQIRGLAKFTANLRIKPKPQDELEVDFQGLIEATRSEDAENNAWNILNRLQEKMIKGGIRYRKTYFDANTKQAIVKSHTTRALKSIDARVSLNRALFDQVLKLAA